jgi:hypothetical protein
VLFSHWYVYGDDPVVIVVDDKTEDCPKSIVALFTDTVGAMRWELTAIVTAFDDTCDGTPALSVTFSSKYHVPAAHGVKV